MPRPTSRTKLQEFLGMVTWLAPFIPNMSENTATLWELLQQDTEFIWNESYDAAFLRIKQLITHRCDPPTLWCHMPSGNPCQRFTLRTRSCPCSRWQTCCLCLQSPHTYKSNDMLTSNGNCWQLSLVLNDSTHVFGCTFTVYTDHKPLEQIQRKTLADAPVHLQRMLLWLQGYDYHHVPPWKGDASSWYPFKICSAQLQWDLTDVTIRHVCIGDTRKASLQELTRTDPLLRSLAETIIDGLAWGS